MEKENYISNKKLIFKLVTYIIIFSIVAIMVSSFYIKQAALNNLAQEDAKKTSELVFETMNVRMQEGWGKEDLNKILDRLEYIRKGMKVNSYRSEKVEEILGVVPKDKEIVNSDKMIQKVMSSGIEEFIIQDDGSIRFLYPMKVTSECITCHFNTKVGDVNGVLDISYPPSDIRISLDQMTYYFIGFFIFFMIILFYIFFLIINKKMVTPIVSFTNEIQKVSKSNDLEKEVIIDTQILEIRTLQKVFNELLKTIKNYYDKLVQSLYKDSMTGLSNLTKLHDDLEYKKGDFTLAVLDISDFGKLNHFYGTRVGDFILKEFSSFLKESIPKDSKVYRLYGDEYAIVFDKVYEKEDIAKLQERIHSHLFSYFPVEIYIQVCIGFVSYSFERSVEKATIALKNAKARNKTLGEYTKALEIEDEYAHHITWLHKTKEAIDTNNIIVFFQPMKSTKTGNIEKYETLVRLKEGEKIYTPNNFIEVSHNARIYSSITKIVINKAFDFFEDKDVSFSINFALEDILNDSTTNLLFERLAKFSDGSRVVIELLETQEISDFELLNYFINRVKVYGAKVAIDDFGSGYSNFNYILNLKVDIVKLDSSLIEDIDKNEKHKVVVKNIVEVAKEFGLEVVAEKVHSASIEEILTDLEVDFLQGYYIGKPSPEILE